MYARGAVVLLTWWLAASLAAQSQGGVIRVSSNLVAVPVLVTDPAGRPVINLSVNDFRLEKEGRLQKIVRLGEPGSAPLDIALLFDVSGSLFESFDFASQAAGEFLRSVLRPKDSVTVFSIGGEPHLILERTTNLAAAQAAIKNLRPTREPTAFYDAVAQAAEYLGKAANPESRRVLVVISDGEDNHSDHAQFNDALQKIQRNDCLFYSLNPGGASLHLNEISMKGQEQMAALASEIGGAYLLHKPEEMPSVLQKIARELQAQYLLGFYAGEDEGKGGYQRLAVLVPNRPELRVRARHGFYAPKTEGD